MVLHLHHLSETKNSTLSELLHEGERLCYILEDGKRKTKIPGETRIPAGSYEVVPRRSGGFFARYKDRFGHGFVPWLLNVKGFTWILIHIGNTIKNTRGCLLTGTSFVKRGRDFEVRNSTDAYRQVYALLAVAFDQGERVFIEIDRGQIETAPTSDQPTNTKETKPKIPTWWLRAMQFFKPY